MHGWMDGWMDGWTDDEATSTRLYTEPMHPTNWEMLLSGLLRPGVEELG